MDDALTKWEYFPDSNAIAPYISFLIVKPLLSRLFIKGLWGHPLDRDLLLKAQMYKWYVPQKWNVEL